MPIYHTGICLGVKDMKNSTRYIVLCTVSFLLINSLVFTPLSKNTTSKLDDIKQNPQLLINTEIQDRRWDIEGITIVYLNGSFYEMGYQLGSLIKEEYTINKRAFLHFYQKEGITYTDLTNLWDIQKYYIPDETIDYIQGAADALNVSFYDVASVWVAEGAAYCRCSSFAAWGDATKNGKLIQMRSLEFPLTIKDPQSDNYVQNSPIIVVADPEGEEYNAFIYPTFAGYVVEDGVNDKGIAIGNMWSPNQDQTMNGAPMGARLFEVLFRASSAQDAIGIITSDRTFGYNFIISDAKVPIAYAVETTASRTYSGTWNDPSESFAPFWPITHVVRRTNCFLDPSIAKTQRSHYNPHHLSYWMGLLKSNPEPWVVIWNHYKALSKGIESLHGDLDVNNTVYMVRDVYHGGYDPIWNMILKLNSEWTTWWQWTTCPASGEIKISFADEKTSAHHNPVFSFNFLKTIEHQHPV